MSKSSNPPAPKVEIKKSTKTETKVLTKSDWPKTPKEIAKMVLNFFLNFFPF